MLPWRMCQETEMEAHVYFTQNKVSLPCWRVFRFFKAHLPLLKSIHWIELCGHILLRRLYEISALDGGMTWHLHSSFVFSGGVMKRWNLSPQSIPSGHSFALSTLTIERHINWDSVPLHGNQFAVYSPIRVSSHTTRHRSKHSACSLILVFFFMTLSLNNDDAS